MKSKTKTIKVEKQINYMKTYNKEEFILKSKTRTTKHKILSVFLSLCMIVACMAGMSITAGADEPQEELLTTITATGKEQASYSTEGVVTVSFSHLPNTATATYGADYFANWGWWGYGWTATVTPADGYTITRCVFYDNTEATLTDSETPFVVETTEQDKTPQVNGTSFNTTTSKGITKIEVYGYATPAAADSDYTITIPATLDVANSGWNAIGDISATGTLASGKRLTVTASSDDKFALVSGANEVAYKLANDTEKEKTYADAAETKSWDFTTLSETPATKPIGIVVEDYSSKPAGTYTDTVTFTASVVDKAVTFTVKRVAEEGYDYADGSYTVAPGTTWQQFIESGNAPACLSIGTYGIYSGKVCHDMNNVLQDCGGTCLANVADKKRVKIGDAIIDGATYGCSDYLGYQDHD